MILAAILIHTVLLCCTTVLTLDHFFSLTGSESEKLGEKFTFEDFFDTDLRPKRLSAQWIGGE